MSDPENTPVTNPTPAQPDEKEGAGWWRERFERARQQAEEDILKRLGISDLDAAEQAIKARAKADEEAALARGEHEKIINELKPQAERAKTLEKTLTAYYEAEIADIPEEKRKLIPSGDVAERLQWVKMAKAEGLFGVPKKPAPNLDAGVEGDRKPQNQQLTAAELETARKMRITPEQYAKFKATGNTN